MESGTVDSESMMNHGSSAQKKRGPSAPSSANHSYASLLSRVDKELKGVQSDLEEAREMVTKAGLTLSDGGLSSAPAVAGSSVVPSTTLTTGGHSNTDHFIVRSGIDAATDRLLEYRRQYLVRRRYVEHPEQRGDDKWDQPHRIPGARRRRIVRDKDRPAAPPEPPPSGYVVFLGQMTTKRRHDRRDERHDQTRLVQEISRLWRHALTEEDREYYHQFCLDVRKEYRKQHLEYRATGYYTPSEHFERNMEGTGLWLRKTNKNRLEMEISTYDTVKFPMRPPSLEEEHHRRELESIQKRKEKLKRQQEELSNGMVKRRRRRRRSGDETNKAIEEVNASTTATTEKPMESSEA
jgi:hypothetical protein